MARSSKDGRVIGTDEISLNLAVADLENPTYILVYMLFKLHADDQGRLVNIPRLLKGKIAPLIDSITPAIIDEAQREMQKLGLVIAYTAADTCLLQIVQWKNTRRWRYPSDYPPPPEWEDDVNCRRQEHEESGEEEVPDEKEAGSPNPSDNVRQRPTTSDDDGQCRLGVGVGVGVGEGVGEGDIAPRKRGRSPPRSRKAKKPTPPAVLAYRRATHRFPPKAWYDRIAEAVGDDTEDLQFWEDMLVAWVGMGWNPQNVKGQLECYRSRHIPGEERQAEKGSPMTPWQAVGMTEERYRREILQEGVGNG